MWPSAPTVISALRDRTPKGPRSPRLTLSLPESTGRQGRGCERPQWCHHWWTVPDVLDEGSKFGSGPVTPSLGAEISFVDSRGSAHVPGTSAPFPLRPVSEKGTDQGRGSTTGRLVGHSAGPSSTAVSVLKVFVLRWGQGTPPTIPESTIRVMRPTDPCLNPTSYAGVHYDLFP